MNERPVIIEMVGIAGAGKTTLRQILWQRNGRIQFRIPPCKPRYVPFLIRHTFLWLPIYLGNYQQSRWFTWKEMKLMGYLETWIPYLRRQALTKDIVVVLDPGSVYWLTALREFGPEITRSQQYERWWKTMLLQWATALDVIIWLDAPDELLYARILARDEWHEVKEQSQKEALEHFVRCRAGYGQIIAAMTAQSGPKVFHFHTDQISPEQMADRVLSVMKLKNGRSQNEH